MKRALIILVILAGVMAMAIAGIAVIFGLTRAAQKRVPSETVLEVDLEAPFIEYTPEGGAGALFYKGTPQIRQFVEAMERAGDDDRVAGLIARIGGSSSGFAISQEIRDSVTRFRGKGKFAVAYSETFGEVSPGNVGYYMATAFDEILMMPSGDVNLTGLISEVPFIRLALDKLGMVPRFDHRYEYKNAKNLFTDTEMTAPYREAMGRIQEVQFNQIVRAIVEARGMTEPEVRALFDEGPLLGQQAVDAGVVDALAYRDEARDRVSDRVNGDVNFMEWDNYLDRADSPYESGEVIALIYGAGQVTRGESGYNAVLGTQTMGSDTVAGAFRSAIKDDEVRGILFRVDSPGGSAVGSDAIWRETIRARELGKPVVVSMGNLAASGGYWVSMDAAKIVAQPGTITASIGVLNGKFLTTAFWDWLGITWDDVQTSTFSTFYSGSYDFTPDEWAYFQAWLDRIYVDFTTKVADGRGLPLERVQEMARGRVWAGQDALDLGLVDELGGFVTALRLLREEAGLDADEPIELRLFPKEKTTLEKLAEMLGDTSSSRVTTDALVDTIRQIQPAARGIHNIAVPPAARGVVHAPAVPQAE
jgi:protease-4